MNVPQFREDMLICNMYAGSHAYGTSTPESDVDFRGIFVADPIQIRTPFYPIHEQNNSNEEDTKYYELNKFMQLATQCNPNIIELLWTDMSDVTLSTPAYELLRSHAADLLCSKIAFTTSGYAFSQLLRIKGHNKWINSPQPVDPPKQSDFISLVHNFTSDKIFSVSLHDYTEGHRLIPCGDNTLGLYKMDGYSPFNQTTGNLNTDYLGNHHELGIPLMIVKFNKLEYNNAKDKWSHYWTWKTNRNEKRGVLEEKYGYDTKHCLHLVRLLRIGAEVLKTGIVNVKRPDAEELLAIRNGAWTYDQVIQYAETMDKHIKEVLYPSTNLRRTPNIKLAAELTLKVQDLMWNKA
jgi:uncharacterized protein